MLPGLSDSTDVRIHEILHGVRSGDLVIPTVGVWEESPVTTRGGETVLARDPWAGDLVLRADTGAVVVDGDDGAYIVNTSLEAFVRSGRLFAEATMELSGANTPINDQEAVRQRVASRLRRSLGKADPGLDDLSPLWATAVEELELGANDLPSVPRDVDARTDSAESIRRPAALVAVTQHTLDAILGQEGWRLVKAIADVTEVSFPARLHESLDLLTLVAEHRGDDALHHEVLIVGAQTAALDAATLAMLPRLRLVCLLGADAEPPAPAQLPAVVKHAGAIDVVRARELSEAGDVVAAILGLRT